MKFKTVAYADIPAAYDRQTDAMLDAIAREQARAEFEEEFWDEYYPDWREMSLDPEDRRYIM